MKVVFLPHVPERSLFTVKILHLNVIFELVHPSFLFIGETIRALARHEALRKSSKSNSKRLQDHNSSLLNWLGSTC